MYFRALYLTTFFPLLAVAAVPGHYIVEMADDPVAAYLVKQAVAGGIHGPAAIAQRAQIRRRQRPVRTLIETAGAEVLDSVDTVANAFIVRIADADASRLASIPGIVHVYPVRRFQRQLDHALPLHRVPEAWQQVGIANAGAGMKIGIIDTGVDVTHPGFKDASIPVPVGFPRGNVDDDLNYTNNKVIVARSYPRLWSSPDTDDTPRDRVGHGTATAMAAAGAANTGPLAAITGVAPKAWIGSYKVFGTPGINDSANDATILKAIDDAVADGMDVINLSLGSVQATRLADDVEVQALERAASLGVLITVSAGNNGPDPNTISSPGTAPSVISVAASKNDRLFAGAATLAGGSALLAIPGSGANSETPITAPLASVAALDQNGLACLPLPAGSLKGRIALILRGQCTFAVKLVDVQIAGAVAALVYATSSAQEPLTMGVGQATLPAAMVGYADGIDLEQQVAQNPSLAVTLTFTLGERIAAAGGLVDFSSQGPNVDLGVMKPDLVAVGTNFYTATQKFDRRGELYDPTGYTVTQGTSFSAPLLAGAAAVLKAARPGLFNAQYRSLLINTAAPWSGSVLQSGAGILDLSAALRGTAAASPTSMSFLVGDGNSNLSQILTISNVGTAATVFQLIASPVAGAPAPILSADRLSLSPGASARVGISLPAAGLVPGQYEGSIRVADTATGTEMHVPYWYAIPGGPKHITVLDTQRGGQPLTSIRNAVVFRVTDASGIALTNVVPVATVISGSGVINGVNSRNSFVPGEYSITLRLGTDRNANVVRIQAGDVIKEVTI